MKTPPTLGNVSTAAIMAPKMVNGQPQPATGPEHSARSAWPFASTRRTGRSAYHRRRPSTCESASPSIGRCRSSSAAPGRCWRAHERAGRHDPRARDGHRRRVPRPARRSRAELPALVGEVRAAVERELTNADEPEPARKLRSLRPTSDPAVPIAESVTPGLSRFAGDRAAAEGAREAPEVLRSYAPAYRVRWGLPADYPMVAPRFGAWRSDYGRTLGLGGVPRLSTEV